MLQRVQTLLLVITLICVGIFLATTSWSKTVSPTEEILVNPYYITHVKAGATLVKTPVFYIATIAGLAGLFTLFTIFQFKNRVRQMLFVALNSILLAIAMSVTFWHITKDANLLAGDPKEVGDFGVGIVAIFVGLVCNWVANRFIKRDEKLVKSADRMR